MRPRRRDEGGAVAILTAICLVLVVTAASFAVDLGMQRVVRSDMQALADAVALDAARLLDGRNAGEIRAGSDGQPALQTAVAASAARNDETALGEVEDVKGTLVYLDSGANGEWQPRRVGGSLVAVPDGAVPDAVLIEARGGVDFAFSTGRGGASREAVATASPFACFRLGSYAAALNTGDTAVAAMFESLVGDALGISLTAVGYQGLLNSYIGLEELAAQLNVGSVEALADLENIQVKDLLAAGARVLSSQGNSAGSAKLNDLSVAVGSGLAIDLGDILSMGDGAAAKGSINAVDLLGSAAFAAASNGTNLLDTGVSWGTIGTGNVEVRAIEAPRQACGEAGSARASTAQVEVQSTLAYTPPSPLPVPGFGSPLAVQLGTSASGVGVYAKLAGATGDLAAIDCGSATASDPESIGVDITTELLSATVSLPLTVTAAAVDVTDAGVVSNALLKTLFPTINLSLLQSVSISGTFTTSLSATTSQPPHASLGTTPYAVPPHDYTDVQSSGGSGPLTLPSIGVGAVAAGSVTVKASVLGLPLLSATTTVDQLQLEALSNALASGTIAAALASTASSLNTVLSSLQTMLGLHVAGADLMGVPRPNCSIPSLVG